MNPTTNPSRSPSLHPQSPNDVARRIAATKAYVMMAAVTPAATGSQRSATQGNFKLTAVDEEVVAHTPVGLFYDYAQHRLVGFFPDTEHPDISYEQEDFDRPIKMSWAGKNRKGTATRSASH